MAGQGEAGKGGKGRQSEAAEVGPHRSLAASSAVTAAVREGPMITWMESSYRSGGGGKGRPGDFEAERARRPPRRHEEGGGRSSQKPSLLWTQSGGIGANKDTRIGRPTG